MANLLTVLVLLSIVPTALLQTCAPSMQYDCRRQPPLTRCSNSGTCQIGGNCQCSGVAGRDCSIQAGLFPQQSSICNCQNGGTCYATNFGLNPTCDCPGGFTGPTCATCRAQLQCTATGLTFTVYPQTSGTGGFSGFLEFVNSAGQPIPTCRQPSTTLNQVWDGNRFLLQNLNLNGQFGTCPAGFFQQLNGDRCYRIFLVYDQRFYGPTDERFTVCCSQSGNVAIVDTVNVQLGTQVTPISVTQTGNIATGQFIYTSSGQPIPATATVSVDEAITYRITGVSGQNNFQVTSCFIEDTPTNIDIITNSCPNPSVFSIFRGIARNTVNGQSVIDINLAAFQLTSSVNSATSQLVMRCTVQACPAGTLCNDAICAGSSFPGIGRRRRRQIADNSTKTEETAAVLHVRLPFDRPSECPATACGLPDAFVPVAVVFGILLVAALVAAVFVCVRLSRRDNAAAKGEPKAYFNPTPKA